MVMVSFKNSNLNGETIYLCTNENNCNEHDGGAHNGTIVYHPKDLEQFKGLTNAEKTKLHHELDFEMKYQWGVELFRDTVPKKLTLADKRKQLKGDRNGNDKNDR